MRSAHLTRGSRSPVCAPAISSTGFKRRIVTLFTRKAKRSSAKKIIAEMGRVGALR